VFHQADFKKYDSFTASASGKIWAQRGRKTPALSTEFEEMRGKKTTESARLSRFFA
jgi:hypothetical protein